MSDSPPVSAIEAPAIPTAGLWSSIWAETGKPLTTYFLHILTGTVLFVLIACAAFSLQLFVKWLEAHGMDSWLLVSLKVVEGGVVLLDSVAYLTFVARMTWKVVRSLW